MYNSHKILWPGTLHNGTHTLFYKTCTFFFIGMPMAYLPVVWVAAEKKVFLPLYRKKFWYFIGALCCKKYSIGKRGRDVKDFCVWLVLGHTQWCLRVTPGFVLSSHSRCAQGIWDAGDQIWVS